MIEGIPPLSFLSLSFFLSLPHQQSFCLSFQLLQISSQHNTSIFTFFSVTQATIIFPAFSFLYFYHFTRLLSLKPRLSVCYFSLSIYFAVQLPKPFQNFQFWCSRLSSYNKSIIVSLCHLPLCCPPFKKKKSFYGESHPINPCSSIAVSWQGSSGKLVLREQEGGGGPKIKTHTHQNIWVTLAVC